MRKMHFYTAIQFVCFACLWVVNMFAISALAFPFVLMLIAVFRLFVVPKFFTVSELEAVSCFTYMYTAFALVERYSLSFLARWQTSRKGN